MVYPVSMLKNRHNVNERCSMPYHDDPWNEHWPRLYWSSDGSRKKAEAKREFSSFLFYELERLGMMPSLMEHYDEMEYRFDAHRIPHQDRKHYKIIEYEYLSLNVSSLA